MITFTEPKTGRTQQVGENERVRISTLKRLGWKQVKDAPVQEAQTAVAVEAVDEDAGSDEDGDEVEVAPTSKPKSRK